MNGDGGVGCPGAAADKSQTRLPRQFAIGNSHKSGTTFVSAGNDFKIIGGGHGIQNGQITLSRHAKCTVQVMLLKAINKKVGSATGHGILLQI
jgi:hypothetical protein